MIARAVDQGRHPKVIIEAVEQFFPQTYRTIRALGS